MRKQNVKPEKFDSTVKRLIASSMRTENEIEKIVLSPVLYSSIRSRVNATSVERVRFGWISVPAVTAFASMLLILGISAIVFLRERTDQNTAAMVPRQVNTDTIKKNSVPDGIGNGFSVSETIGSERIEQPRMSAQTATYRKQVSANFRPPRPRAEKLPDLEFIPLVYTDDPADSVRGGRIIRVELSRASLFAMGINVPLENGAETVKADLLVGQDGVPRAIRMP